MRIVARLKRGSLFRLLFYADARRAPHASRTASSSSSSSTFSSSSSRDVNVICALACGHYTHIRTFTRIRYLATVRPLEKQFDLAAQVRWVQPPSSFSLALSPFSLHRSFLSLQTCLSVGFPDAEFDFAMCAHSRVYRKCKLWRTRA